MVCVVSVTGIKHAAPVEAELGDAVDDVISRSMLVGFFRSLFYLLGVPAFAELFNRAHIDEAIVQMVAERGHVLHQKHLIHVDGVSCKRAFTCKKLSICNEEVGIRQSLCTWVSIAQLNLSVIQFKLMTHGT